MECVWGYSGERYRSERAFDTKACLLYLSIVERRYERQCSTYLKKAGWIRETSNHNCVNRREKCCHRNNSREN